jgi:glycine betaine catabolism A
MLRTLASVPPDFDKSKYALKSARVELMQGFIFVTLSDNPPDFAEARRELSPLLAPHDFSSAKICHTREYNVKANWKLIIENSRECYHCHVGHPEYTRIMLHEGVEKSPDGKTAKERWDASYTRLQNLGLTMSCARTGWFHGSRYPLSRVGAVTESLDGNAVAPLMGSFKEPDGGVIGVVLHPTFMFEASADYGMSLGFTPVNATLTNVRIDWYVRGDAVEGRDYIVDRVIAFWKATAEQDWKLCEDNQAGVNSSRYEPGPYGLEEGGVNAFLDWYINQVR